MINGLAQPGIIFIVLPHLTHPILSIQCQGSMGKSYFKPTCIIWSFVSEKTKKWEILIFVLVILLPLEGIKLLMMVWLNQVLLSLFHHINVCMCWYSAGRLNE